MNRETNTGEYLMPVRELMDILGTHTADARARSRARRTRRLRARFAAEPLATPRRLAVPAAPSHSRDASSR